MTNTLRAINVAVLALLTAACVSLTAYQPSDAFVRSVERVVERHDLYLQTDPGYTQDEVEILLTESAAVLLLLDNDADGIDRELYLALISPLLERHDAFVNADEGLDDVEKGIYLESSARIRSILTRES